MFTAISNIPTNSYVVFRNIRDPTEQSSSRSFLNLIQSKSTVISPTVKQQFQELVKHIRRKSRSESLDQDDSPGSSPNMYSILESIYQKTSSNKESGSTKTLDDTTQTHTVSDLARYGSFPVGCYKERKPPYHQKRVLDEIRSSLSRRTRHHNIGDDMNEKWIFENKSVKLEASNCHVCGEYMMTSNYDFYVDILPSKCMCKCEH